MNGPLGVQLPYDPPMDMSDAMRLRSKWQAKGSPPCEHPRVEKERMQGMDTGDKVCTTCGQTFFNGRPVGD